MSVPAPTTTMMIRKCIGAWFTAQRPVCGQLQTGHGSTVDPPEVAILSLFAQIVAISVVPSNEQENMCKRRLGVGPTGHVGFTGGQLVLQRSAPVGIAYRAESITAAPGPALIVVSIIWSWRS